MYGGVGTVDSATRYFDEVWVLSIPSFLWIAVNDTNNSERNNDPQSAGRRGHTFTMWQEDQMIVLGGIYLRFAATIPQPVNGLSVTSGKSTLNSPGQGWADSELSDIFSRRLPRVGTSQSTGSFRSTTTSTQVPSLSSGGLGTGTADPKPSGGNSPAQSRKKKTSAIIGGAIGGPSLFLIAATSMLYYFKKHQKRRLEVPPEIKQDTEPVMKPWERAELEDDPKHELSGTSKALPELPAESREELSANYHGVEMQHTVPRSWLRFGTHRSPVELPLSNIQETVSAELSTSGNDDEVHGDELHATHNDQIGKSMRS
ncbi:MAG: hypothetical protein Q9195_009525 [Heterodermia aff. obscurata]